MNFDTTQHGSQNLWLEVVDAILATPGAQPREMLLDLCCNDCAATRHLGFKKVTAVDVEPTELLPLGWRFVQADVIQFLRSCGRGEYQVAICSDGLEHLREDDGYLLVREMARVAKFSVIFSPLNDFRITPQSSSPHAHKSVWCGLDLIKLGWQAMEFPNWHPRLRHGAFFAWRNNA